MSMKFAYQRDGARLVSWNSPHGIPPYQARAADTLSLGSLAGSTLDNPTLVLPRPGAPEPISGLGGCSCSGTCGCGSRAPMAGIADAVPGGYLGLAAAGLVAWLLLRGKKRK